MRKKIIILPKEPNLCESENFFAIHGSFCEIDMFPLAVFSIHTFSLSNFKSKENAARQLLFSLAFLHFS